MHKEWQKFFAYIFIFTKENIISIGLLFFSLEGLRRLFCYAQNIFVDTMDKDEPKKTTCLSPMSAHLRYGDLIIS